MAQVPAAQRRAAADQKWEPKLGVKVSGYFLQRMKTKWGSCNHRAGHIRLNTELVKKPKDLLEYVIVHEMVHLLEPTHSERFIALLDTNYPSWREPARSSMSCRWRQRFGESNGTCEIGKRNQGEGSHPAIFFALSCPI